MAKHGGGTQGFGRVSAHTRPSPYSPLQFRGSLPTTQREKPAVPQVRGAGRRRRRIALAAAVIAVVAAGAGIVALFRPAPLPAPSATSAPAPSAIPDAGEQARRGAPLPLAKRT